MEANIVEDRVPIVYNEVDMELSDATYTETEPDFALVAAAVAEAGDYQVTPAR